MKEKHPYSQDPPKTALKGTAKESPRRLPTPFAALLITVPIVEEVHNRQNPKDSFRGDSSPVPMREEIRQELLQH